LDATMKMELRPVDFEKIRRLIYEKCGINLHEGKKELVSARLGKRLREGKFRSFAHYYDHVVTEEGADELVRMIDSISTNLTYFFREDSHFQKLTAVLPHLLAASGNKSSPRLRIWSAACSTGEEPYSAAIKVRETMNGIPVDVKILATDISTSVLKTAASGIYNAEKIKNIPPGLVKKYFQGGSGKWEGYYRVKNEIRELVQFKRFNLMQPPPQGVYFDIIFCRNVMIYFDKQTQSALVNRLYDSLVSGGYLFIGHSESLTGLNHRLKYIEPSVYRK
jgi:chemotaxis protein methyltransferase CheR